MASADGSDPPSHFRNLADDVAEREPGQVEIAARSGQLADEADVQCALKDIAKGIRTRSRLL
jgi:hypothetical protein